MRTPIRTVGAFGGSTEPAVLPGRTCLTYGPIRDAGCSGGGRNQRAPYFRCRPHRSGSGKPVYAVGSSSTATCCRSRLRASMRARRIVSQSACQSVLTCGSPSARRPAWARRYPSVPLCCCPARMLTACRRLSTAKRATDWRSGSASSSRSRWPSWLRVPLTCGSVHCGSRLARMSAKALQARSSSAALATACTSTPASTVRRTRTSRGPVRILHSASRWSRASSSARG